MSTWHHLIADLKLLWETGVKTYDAYMKEYFNLRAILLWTINEFPAYGNLSGFVTKGYYACPICSENTCSQWLPNSKKVCFLGHRRFLPLQHPLRKRKKYFNNQQEDGVIKQPLSGEEIYDYLTGFETSGEKNVCESVYGTLLNLPGKTKDGLRARQDLEVMGIKLELQTQPRGNRTWLPPACYTLNTTEKHQFYETLSTIKVPNRYCSNFKNLVSDDVSKMNGLKSNDCHVLMQQLLPFAIKGVLHVKVRKTIIEEALEFFSDYLKNMKSIGNPHERVDERIRTGKPLSRGTVEGVDAKLLDEAHLYVLRNTADVELQHMLELNDHNPRASRNSKWLQTQRSRTFISWLKTKVDTHFANGEDICESVRWLAKGPSFAVKKYSGFAINEYRFHTTSRDESRTTQCSGVSLVAHVMQIASAKYSNPMYGAVTYYGRIQEIWDLDYRIFTVPVFMCDWVDSRGIKKDDFGFTVVNFARLDHQSERLLVI
ncbi:uncharacterized protein LOC120121300 [Hibiscus syriacus]|uniref:uncharacterized protein LOC120121300 n=1 Tax=Hibiscus syriacus TaxID=106335 RepID=UPI001924846D|nr:uncharacterized protein LOC120121300 [Hibiscus syriacus]